MFERLMRLIYQLRSVCVDEPLPQKLHPHRKQQDEGRTVRELDKDGLALCACG